MILNRILLSAELADSEAMEAKKKKYCFENSINSLKLIQEATIRLSLAFIIYPAIRSNLRES